MHICYASIDYHGATSGGGIASYTQAIAEELVRRGHRVTVLAKARGADPPAVRVQAGVKVHWLQLGDLHYYLGRPPGGRALISAPVREWEWSRVLRNRIEALDREHPIDVLELTETAFLFSHRARISGRTIMRIHGDAAVFARKTGGRASPADALVYHLKLGALRRVDAVSAPSRAMAAETERDMGWSAGAVKAIPNPVHPAFFELAGAHMGDAENPVPANPRILYAARIQRTKGILVLLDAMAGVWDKHPEAELILAGGGHPSIHRGEFDRALDRTGHRGRIHLMGNLSRERLMAEYRQATLVVVPSYWESFCITAAEAMCFATPIVGTRCGGLEEVVDDGRQGVLVAVGDAPALAAAILALLADSLLAASLGRRGREAVRSRFAPHVVAEKMLEFYRGQEVVTPL